MHSTTIMVILDVLGMGAGALPAQGPSICTPLEELARPNMIWAGEPSVGYHGMAYAGGSFIRDPEGKLLFAEPPIVKNVVCHSPADSAGVQAGDVILAVNGKDSRDPALLVADEPGERFLLRIRRNSEILEITVTSVRRPDDWPGR